MDGPAGADERRMDPFSVTLAAIAAAFTAYLAHLLARGRQD